jgi:hypothetical protein
MPDYDRYLAQILAAPSAPVATPTATQEPGCNAYFDDFSNPNSGWPSGESPQAGVQYVGGEYRFYPRQAGTWTLRSPAGAFSEYALETDIRWPGLVGDSYGLAFGITPDSSSWYFFDLNTEFQHFRVKKSDGTIIIPVTESDAILPGNAVNHVEAVITNDAQTFFINDIEVGTASDPISGTTGSGIVVGAFAGLPDVAAHFDNYCITTPGGLPPRTGSSPEPALDLRSVVDPFQRYAPSRGTTGFETRSSR